MKMHDIRRQLPDQRRPGFLFSMDPRIKILSALGLLLINLSARGMGLSLMILVLCALLLLTSRITFREFGVRMILPFMVAAMVIVAQVFWSEGECRMFDFHFAGIQIAGTLEGLFNGLRTGLQVLAGVILILVLSMTTSSHRLLQGVRWFRCPELIIEIAILMHRYIFLLLEEGSRIREAQRVRLGFVSTRKALRAAGVLGGMLFIRAYGRAERTMEAMTCRGYGRGTGTCAVTGLGKPLFSELVIAALVLTVFYFLR
jgi:cobalt/nickel transport system permease protein